MCGLFGKDLDKTKTANTSHIKFLLMAYKTSLYLIKLITFTCTDLSPKKAYEVTKEKKCGFELISSKSSSLQF